jgi:ribosomal protein L3
LLGATAPQRVRYWKKTCWVVMGNETVTIRRVEIVDVDTEHNIISVKGPVPGNRSQNCFYEKKWEHN